MRYMQDTDTCISLIKARPEKINRRLSRLLVEEVGVSSIAAAEMWYGVALTEKKKQNEAALRDFLDFVNVLDWPRGAGAVYGRIRAYLKKNGVEFGNG
jgi:tRNA(fMet)-specific endonuclease VapC